MGVHHMLTVLRNHCWCIVRSNAGVILLADVDKRIKWVCAIVVALCSKAERLDSLQVALFFVYNISLSL